MDEAQKKMNKAFGGMRDEKKKEVKSSEISIVVVVIVVMAVLASVAFFVTLPGVLR